RRRGDDDEPRRHLHCHPVAARQTSAIERLDRGGIAGAEGGLTMFLRAMIWKELREQRLQALILTVIGLLVLTVAFPMFGDDMALAATAPLAAIVFAWACGMVTGAIALANERET